MWIKFSLKLVWSSPKLESIIADSYFEKVEDGIPRAQCSLLILLKNDMRGQGQTCLLEGDGIR